MDIKLKRTPGLYLAGFMCSGKTTVGSRLADRVGWDFVDVDKEIERTQNAKIESIFDTRGEEEFRRIESEMLRNVVRQVERGIPAIVALGGGAFLRQENFELLANNGISVWLDCPLEAIVARLQADANSARPLARDPEALRKLYEGRRTGYSRADYRIDAGLEPDRVVEAILELPFWK